MRLDYIETYKKLDREELIKQIEREEDKQMWLALLIIVAFVLGVVLG